MKPETIQKLIGGGKTLAGIVLALLPYALAYAGHPLPEDSGTAVTATGLGLVGVGTAHKALDFILNVVGKPKTSPLVSPGPSALDRLKNGGK